MTLTDSLLKQQIFDKLVIFKKLRDLKQYIPGKLCAILYLLKVRVPNLHFLKKISLKFHYKLKKSFEILNVWVMKIVWKQK